MTRIAVYPGSFDPVTNGHLDVIVRSASLFDQVVVAVGKEKSKSPMFSAEERTQLIESCCQHLDNVQCMRGFGHHTYICVCVQYTNHYDNSCVL